MTLHQLRALLERAHGPAVERLTDRTPEGVALTYLTRHLSFKGPAGAIILPCPIDEQMWWDIERQTNWRRESLMLDLTDPGTVNAVKVALALALGLDPGPMGSDCRWHHRCPGAPVWVLEATDSEVAFVRWDPRGVDEDGFDRELHAPTVAAEPDPVRALILAVEHVLCSPA